MSRLEVAPASNANGFEFALPYLPFASFAVFHMFRRPWRIGRDVTHADVWRISYRPRLYPGDLMADSFSNAPYASSHAISVSQLALVIPTLNAVSVDRVGYLAQLKPSASLGKIIIADGGSTDATCRIAKEQGAHVVHAPRGRGPQLAAGARAADTPWLLFLHADTRLSPGWEAAVAAHMADPANRHVAGAFRLAFDDESPAARRTAALANWRTRRLGLPYGDQGLLISRALYDAVGGYPEIPLMEDVAMARKLGRQRIRMLDATAVTSAEKYRRDGWWRRSAKNLTLLSLYFLGVPPARLAGRYR